MRLETKIDARGILKELKRYEGVIDDLSEFYEEIARPRLIKHIQETFSSLGFGTWPSLSPRYAAYKRAKYGNKPLLRRTDRLYNAYRATADGGDTISVITKTSFEHGVTVPYAIYHETGTSRMPPRPVIGAIIKRQLLNRSYVRSLNKWLRERFGD